jgi:GNAT superfamily N-acetyltransferase
VNAPPFRVEPLSLERFAAFSSLHEGPGCAGCFCMYWQYEGDNRAWQLARPEDNREAKLRRVSEGRTHGLLAFDGELAVGAIQLEPRASLVKLTARMPYRDLGPDEGCWSIGCLLVRPSHRRRGVSRALVLGAIEHLSRDPRAVALEAYPRLGEELREEELWTGPDALFAQCGFTVAREHMQYPVLRRALRDDR